MSEREKEPLKVPEILPEGTLRDFLLPIVEFLGILVPGSLFLLLAIPAIAVPVTYARAFVLKGRSVTIEVFGYVVDLLRSSSIAVAGVALVASYVAGHIFFRQDPKIPDERSFNRVKETIGDSGPVRRCDAEIAHNKAKGIEPSCRNGEPGHERPRVGGASSRARQSHLMASFLMDLVGVAEYASAFSVRLYHHVRAHAAG